MTRETRLLVELNDVLGIELECRNPKCKAKIMLSLDVDISRVNPNCFQCGQPLFDATYDHATGQSTAILSATLIKFAETLSRLRDPERTDIHAPIRLHIGSVLDEVVVRASGDKG